MPKSEILARSVATNEAVTLVRPEGVILSSSTCPWRDSFKVEHHRRPVYEQEEVILPQANVVFFSDRMKSPCPVEWRIAGGSLKQKSLQRGEIAITAKDTPIWGRCFAPSDILIISFSPNLLNAAIADAALRGFGLKEIIRISLGAKQRPHIGVSLAVMAISPR